LLACAGFFDGHGVAVEKAPDRARRHAQAMVAAQKLGNLNQGHIRFGLDRGEDLVLIGFDPLRALVAAPGPGAPVSRQHFTQRTALETETPNRSAAARRDIPPSTASITRPRRSSQRGLIMQAGLLHQPAS
jgi:hypothetical protein